jgi:hypothetical protein
MVQIVLSEINFISLVFGNFIITLNDDLCKISVALANQSCKRPYLLFANKWLNDCLKALAFLLIKIVGQLMFLRIYYMVFTNLILLFYPYPKHGTRGLITSLAYICTAINFGYDCKHF